MEPLILSIDVLFIGYYGLMTYLNLTVINMLIRNENKNKFC